MAKAKSHSTRSYDEEPVSKMAGCAAWTECLLLMMLAIVLLLGSSSLAVTWVLMYKDGFGWTNEPHKQFNLHPVLMILGFITFSGFSLLLYRLCRGVRRLYVKLLHTVFHALAIPCVVVGFIAAWDFHRNSTPPLNHFYSLHSWMGLATMGLFALQFAAGFFNFLILLCCYEATQAYRASLVPVHAAFGLATFAMAVATCLTGLTQNVVTKFGSSNTLQDENIVTNTLAVTLTMSGVVVLYIVSRRGFGRCGRYDEGFITTTED